MTVMTPANEDETWKMLNTALALGTPAAVRYPRGGGPGTETVKDDATLPLGKGMIERKGKGLAVMSFGAMLAPALAAAEKLDATVANMRFVKPLDEELVIQLAKTHETLATVEENAVMGGAGDAVAECLQRHGIRKPFLQLGIGDAFVQHGSPDELLKECGLDASGVEKRLREWMRKL